MASFLIHGCSYKFYNSWLKPLRGKVFILTALRLCNAIRLQKFISLRVKLLFTFGANEIVYPHNEFLDAVYLMFSMWR